MAWFRGWPVVAATKGITAWRWWSRRRVSGVKKYCQFLESGTRCCLLNVLCSIVVVGWLAWHLENDTLQKLLSISRWNVFQVVPFCLQHLYNSYKVTGTLADTFATDEGKQGCLFPWGRRCLECPIINDAWGQMGRVVFSTKSLDWQVRFWV